MRLRNLIEGRNVGSEPERRERSGQNILRYLVRTGYRHPVLIFHLFLSPPLVAPLPGAHQREERYHGSPGLLHRVESLLRSPLGHGKQGAQAAQTGMM